VRYEFKPSFDRSIKALPPHLGEEIKLACIVFIDTIESRLSLACGFGLKRLKDDYWEIRKGIKNRILFRWSRDLVEFILAGDHDTIKKFLRFR